MNRDPIEDRPVGCWSAFVRCLSNCFSCCFCPRGDRERWLDPEEGVVSEARLLRALRGAVQLLDESQRNDADQRTIKPIAEWLRHGPNRNDHDAVDDVSERPFDVDSDDANFVEFRSDGELRLESVDSDEFQSQEAEEAGPDEFQLQGLPEEVLEHIFDYIGIHDTISMRSICKNWHWLITRVIFGKLIGEPASGFSIVHRRALFSRHCKDVRDRLSSEISQGEAILVHGGDSVDCFVMLVLDGNQLKELIQNSVPYREAQKFWSVNGEKIRLGAILSTVPCGTFFCSIVAGCILIIVLPKWSLVFVPASILAPIIPAFCCSVLFCMFSADCINMCSENCSKESGSYQRRTTFLGDTCFWIRHAPCRALRFLFGGCCKK